MELYKYCKRDHLPLRGSSCSVRVGTLHDYRNTEKYGELISDIHEGSKIISGTVANLSKKNIHQYPNLGGIIELGESGSIGSLVMTNCTIISENMFIFSAAQEYSRSEHERWYEEEGYDACYRIHSARLFFREISRALGSRGQFIGFAPVHYVESFDLSSPNIHPALVKRQSKHHSQREVRAIWRPTDGAEVKGVLLGNTSIGRYCTTHHIIGDA